MPQEILDVFSSSIFDAAITIIKYMLVAAILAVAYIWIKAKLKKKMLAIKAKKEENKK